MGKVLDLDERQQVTAQRRVEREEPPIRSICSRRLSRATFGIVVHSTNKETLNGASHQLAEREETGMTSRQRGRLAGAGLDALLQMKDGRLKREVHRLKQSDEWEEPLL